MSTSKVAQDLLRPHAKETETILDDVIVEYVGALFESWYSDGYGIEELMDSLEPVLVSAGMSEAAVENFLCSLDAAFGVKSRTGTGPQISAVVPIETPVQMSLAPITAQMCDEPKQVHLDWLATKRVVASQVDRSKLERAEQKLRMKAQHRYRKAAADQSAFIAEAVQKQLELMNIATNAPKTPVEIVDEMLAESVIGPSSKRDIIVEGFDISLVGRRILTNASLTLAYGRRYGLIGRNGIGKSTLLRYIASYQLDISKSISVLHVEQEVIGDNTLALKSVLQADVKREALLSEEARLSALMTSSEDPLKAVADRLHAVYRLLQDMDSEGAEARACTILSGLGFSSTDFSRKTKEFSGGWRMRLALARALFCRPDLLLLDEPTNMLDFPAVVWLENYLREWPSTLLVVSHDRYFLDGVATDIIHMHNEQLDPYRGDYNQFVATRAERLKNQQREYEAQALYRANLQAFVDRWRYNANRAPQAQSRLKILEKLPDLKPVVVEAPVVFRFPLVEQISPPIIQIENASFSYDPEGAKSDPSKILLKNIDLNVQLDLRMAIVGPNGAGKTTLLKLMVGKLAPISGRVFLHGRLRIAYFNQHHVDQLDVSLNPLQVLQAQFPGKPEEDYRAQLGAFGISGPLGLQTIRTLSGGQKSRVTFALMCLQSPHVMILDEPTNHLDMDSIDALISALKAFKGGVVVVSHDKKFIGDVCNQILVCKDNILTKFDGSIHEYAASLTDGIGKHQ